MDDSLRWRVVVRMSEKNLLAAFNEGVINQLRMFKNLQNDSVIIEIIFIWLTL